MNESTTDASATDAPATDAPKASKPKRDKHAKVRAAILAAPNMEAIAAVLGVGGKTVFRPWVRANIAHFGTNTSALLTGKSKPKGGTREVPNVERIIARFVEGKRDA